MTSALEITGLPELDLALGKLTPKIRRKILRKSARKAAKPLAVAAKAYAPKKTGLLAKSIKVRAAKRKGRNKGNIGVVVITDPKVLVKQGEDGKNARNPHWFENGAPGHMTYGKKSSPLPARPFMRPAMDQTAPQVMEIFQGEIRKDVEEATREARIS